VRDFQCCPLSEGDEPAHFSRSVTRTARKEHKCCECCEPIPVGATYEHYIGKWDGDLSTYKTCASCVEIRNHFACNGWVFTMLWADLEEGFFPDMRAGGPCMEGLSAAAKGRLFDRRMAWMERRNALLAPPAVGGGK
jgi:hypothetical protein